MKLENLYNARVSVDDIYIEKFYREILKSLIDVSIVEMEETSPAQGDILGWEREKLLRYQISDNILN